MSQLMGDRRDITARTVVARENVGMMRGGEGCAKGSPAFSCAHFGVNPSFLKEVCRQCGKLFIKMTKGREDKRLSLGKGQLFCFCSNRRIEVRVLECVESQQPGLEAKILLRQRIVPFDRLHHRFHRLWCDLIGEVGWEDHIIIMTYLALDLVIEKHGIED